MTIECPIFTAARSFPDQPALEFEGTTWSWRAVADAVGGFTEWLRHEGIGPGDRVAVMSWNRPEVLFLWFGLARRGASLVPINARLTATEAGPLVDRARAKFALVSDGLRERLPAGRAWPVVLPRSDAASELEEDAELAALFTSGTTGSPSLVPLTTANFLAAHHANAGNLGAHHTQVWLGTLPLFHVGGLAMAFRWAMMGARLVLEPGFDANRANGLLRRGDVTHASMVPTALSRLIDGQSSPYPEALQALLIGGGPMGAALLQRARSLRLPVLQTYGLTEACSQVTTERPTEADGTTAGRALPGLEVRIVDEAGQVSAAGVAGLVQVKGGTVTSGAGEWLATNDLGTLDSRQRLTIHARRVDLIVSGGENVYPAEVEEVIAESPLVADVAVMPVPDEQWGQVPVALVVWKSAPQPSELEAFLRSRLAGFKVPRRFATVEALPRNASGKLLRRALLALFTAARDSC